MKPGDPHFVAGGASVQHDWLSGVSGYSAIYADPPWRFDTRSNKGRGRSPDWVENEAPLPLFGIEGAQGEVAKHYRTMSVEEIEALDVGPLAGRDCVLYLWAVLNMLPEALRVGKAWGFTPKTARVWIKTRVNGFDPSLTLDQNFPMGTGYIVRGNPELLLILTRGSPSLRCAPRALIVSERREHSRKPDLVRRDIERQVAGPWLELFAQTAAPGWDAWGDQVGKFEVAA